MSEGGDGPNPFPNVTGDDGGTPDADDESVQSTLDGAADEGGDRLARSMLALLATGAVAGIDVGIGVLAKLSVMEATGSELLGGLAFGIGFVAILLGKSELFTENFLLPVTAVYQRRRSVRSLLRLWTLTGVGNLAGGWVIMGIIVIGVPRIGESDVLLETSNHFVEMGLGWPLFFSALLGGAAITLMTWMEQATDSVGAKLVAVIGIGFVLASTPLAHAVVTSLEMFGALQRTADFGYADWAGVFGIAVVGNLLGGIVLVTVLRMVQGRAQDQPDS
ncbi:formate/nitrite transporter family protein [Salsipaludibacter albus]|uniref:formate/nitrite transporter family protein n=1 Tax=Salsipaludibacter albus TaxID=2849650 RepID=UPI001EE4AC95|nr:formate/nitrite transporter family protein [Salsipaludibacter albus]